MKVIFKFYDKETGKKMINSSTLFINYNGDVCEITEQGDRTFLVARVDIGYSAAIIHDYGD